MVKGKKVHSVPAKFCPQAVIEWSNFNERDPKRRRKDFDRQKVLEDAKSHLSAVGWAFWYGQKSGRYELRYTSPAGKSYYSLRSACRVCIADGAADENSAEKVEGFSGEIATPNGKSPSGESCSSSSDSGSDSPAARRSRKRKLDFDSVQSQSPVNLPVLNEDNVVDSHNVDEKEKDLTELTVDDLILVPEIYSEKPSCSSEEKPVAISPEKLLPANTSSEPCIFSEKPSCSSEKKAIAISSEKSLEADSSEHNIFSEKPSCSSEQKSIESSPEKLLPVITPEPNLFSEKPSCSSEPKPKPKPKPIPRSPEIVMEDDILEPNSSEKPSHCSEPEPEPIPSPDFSSKKPEPDLSPEKPSCSSEPTKPPVRRVGKVIADIKSSMEESNKGKGGKKRKANKPNTATGSNNKRAKKTPKTNNRPRQNGWRIGLAPLIDAKLVNLGDRVTYRGKPSSGGSITREGIKCQCCGSIFTLTTFEDHVGSTNHRPAANIILSDGRSLADCKNQLNSVPSSSNPIPKSNPKSHEEDKSDDICSVCNYGGVLVLCDACPSAYHAKCIGLKSVPDGNWFCHLCRCGICGNGGGDDDMVTCLQCERKFHGARCLAKKEALFCGRDCEEVCSGLRALVGKPVPVGHDGLTWTLLKSREKDPRLEAALGVMHQCFEPANDPLTQRDMVKDVIYGRRSELSRMNFAGFYVAVLEKEGSGETVSVATVRVRGKKLAEVPLVATGFAHRRLGMCRVLVDELEKRLVGLGVERLTLPAAPGVLQTWVGSFGFSKMSFNERLEVLPYNLLDFQDTTMCHKKLVETKKSMTSKAEPSPVVDNVNGYYSTYPEAKSEDVSAKPFMGCGFMDKKMMAAKVGV